MWPYPFINFTFLHHNSALLVYNFKVDMLDLYCMSIYNLFSFRKLPVHWHNFLFWPSHNRRSVDDRYTAIVEAAKTRSVLALGVSCWRVTRDEPEPEYYVQTYNILLLSRDNYTVEPGDWVLFVFMVTVLFPFSLYLDFLGLWPFLSHAVTLFITCCDPFHHMLWPFLSC
jgi:hypothetical protein